MIAPYQERGKLGDALSFDAAQLVSVLQRHPRTFAELQSEHFLAAELPFLDQELQAAGLTMVVVLRALRAREAAPR
jgi:hypothetical protein